MTTPKPLQIHVTRVNGSDVHGHEARLCSSSGGCGANELYFDGLDAREHNVRRGQLIEWDQTARIVWLLSEV